MRIHRTLSFSHEEQQILARAALSIHIAFDVPDRSDTRAWKNYKGRHLTAAAKVGRDKLTPEQVHGAWEAAQELAAVLEAESKREYWEYALSAYALSAERAADPPTEEMPRASTQVMGLVAPGTDICGMLAETRSGQLREVQAAVVLLQAAVTRVGPPEPTESDESWEDV